MRKATSLALLVSIAAGLGAAHADVPMPPTPDPRGGISGSWYNPEQSGHGLHIERLDDGKVALAWYTFDAQGQPLWLFGTGAQRGDRIVALAYETAGGRPPPLWDDADVVQDLWGELRLEFTGCNDGELRWNAIDPAFGEGSLPIRRLTRIEGSRCNAENEFSQQFSWSFQMGHAGFAPVFADVPENPDEAYELDSQWERIEAPLDSRAGIRLTGHNRSDDLAMLVKAPIYGLIPNGLYRVELDAELASNVPTGCAGVGGSPGDSVYVKLGASTLEPLALPQEEGPETMLRLNVDFGNQSQSGSDALVVGTLAVDTPCDNGASIAYHLRDYSTRGTPFRARADGEGRLWVMAGIDSAFEGFTELYVTGIRARLERVNEDGF